jgi:hypothetical protein
MSLYEDVFDQVEDLGRISRQLDRLSEAYGITGNIRLMDQFAHMVSEIDTVCKSLMSSVGRDSDKRLAEASQSTANMINACLAVSKINKEK